MAKVLYVKANPKSDQESNTFTLANAFLDTYKEKNPSDEIVVLDLYKENLKNLDHQMITDMFAGKETEMIKYAKEFATYDKYIFAAPMWNLSFPAILKTYIDYISYVGITFKYTENGPVGLLQDKQRKAVHIVSRGGMYSEGPGREYENGDRYLRTILGFFGIPNVETVAFELTNVLQGEAFEAAKKAAHEQAKQVAEQF